MTREEAIKCLINERDNHINTCNGVFYETRTEAINMAIKALEQEPCEDCISRQAVLDLIADYDLSMGQVVRGIHALPSVTPKQRVGRWIDTDNYYRRWKCSECGYHTRDEEPNYCPYCGAKMVEPQESEEE